MKTLLLARARGMRALSLLARAFVVVAFGCVVAALWLYDNACEAWKKHKLGAAYEGPLDGWEK